MAENKTAPQPTPDSLAEFIMDNADVDVQWGSPVFDFKGLAAALQDRYLVLDPDDEVIIDRIAYAIAYANIVTPFYREKAKWIISLLSEMPSE